MLNRSEFNFIIIEPLVPLIYAAFGGKNEYSMTQIRDFDPILGFSSDNHTWWPTVHWPSLKACKASLLAKSKRAK